MDYAAGNVIANSTFSWWGVWMARPGVPVVAPRPWFATGEDAEGLLPQQWATVSRGDS